MSSPARETHGSSAGPVRRGAAWYGGEDVASFIHRAFTKAMGYDDDDLQRPLIGICSTYSELNHCNRGLRDVAEAVKRGVLQAGGLPLEFPTISIGEVFVSPTSMLLRNLAAMDTEEMIRAQPLDGVVLLASCDKTTPAALMGAASADVPALLVTGGPMLNGRYEGQDLGACTDCRRYWTEYRAGTVSRETMIQLEDNLARSEGHCMVMGTASTMAACAEAMGMMLLGGAAIPAPDSRRLRFAEASGRQIVRLAQAGIRPSQVMTRAAFENAIRLLHAVGGSTNAVVHLPAIAGRLGIELPLDLFDSLSRTTPWLANIRPAGAFQMERLFEVGGIPAVLKELEPLLHLDCLTVSGQTMGQNLAQVTPIGARSERAVQQAREVIAALDTPLDAEGGLAVLRGNLAPDGAVIKHAAASPHLLRHRGPALVFSSLADLQARIDDPQLDVTPEHVLVLQQAGPLGGPGMPEVGNLPLPKKLLAQGVRDMVRLSDARMSGTAYGTIVLHIAPESAAGGPLAAVRSGDMVELDVPARQLNLLVPQEEIQRRLAAFTPPPRPYRRGYGRLFLEHVLQAPQGCDFDFLVGTAEDAERAARLSRDLRT
ncbi:MAG TPA: IlvD/Edd family dehydratase [Chloroflexota bacterium]|nr:IlvD/Edd family dehydratase [Chloroflexota bacterium]